jgi:nucleoside-triphosphatase
MMRILITGVPGSGKTTCIRKIAEHLEDRRLAGFYTRELRESGERVGFELAGFDGRQQILAHTAIPGRYRVGKYGVDIAGFEEYLSSLTLPSGKDCVIVIDEIGKMECLSPLFREMITRLLDDGCLLVATIAKRGDRFIEEIKRRDDAMLFELTRENRDILPGRIIETITGE